MHLQRLVTHIDAVVREKIKSIQHQHGFIIPPPAVQRVKVGDPIRTEHHGFAVDHECRLADPESGLRDEGVTVRPIIAAPREQPHALAFTLDDQAKTVVLDLVKEIRSGWDFSAARWEARLILILAHHAAR